MFVRISGVLVIGLLTPQLVSAQGPAPAGGKRALLVGCSKYWNLPLAMHLPGAANDVALMRDFLMNQFNFPKENIVVLSEENGGADPTRANIQRAFVQLARAVQPGDQVVIFLAGHGSQQPQSDPDDPDDYEPNGLDQLFLPSDVSEWNSKIGAVANAIADNDLRAWLKPIRDRGGRILVIVDACHSASMVRGGDQEQVRQVPMDLLRIPEAVIRQAQERARARRPEPDRPTDGLAAPFRLPEAPDLVAIYAAPRAEEAPDTRLPPGSADAKRHGFLTFALVQVVTQATEPLTYTELAQRIHTQYLRWNRSSPTPLVEGKDRDREFLGVRQWPGRSRFRIQKDTSDSGTWKLSGGAIHGLTADSILAVYPPASQAKTDQPLGHVRISRLRTVDAGIEPVAYAKLPAPKALPEDGRCEPVYVDYGSLRLRVAVDGSPHPVLARELQRLEQAPRTLVRTVADPVQADWLVRIQDGQGMLLPASGWLRPAGNSQPAPFGPVPIDDEFGRWLEEHLTRIARARNLVSLAAAGSSQRGPGGPLGNVEVDLYRFADRLPTTPGELVRRDGRKLVFHPGEALALRITNRNPIPVDVTLLFVDSGYGISLVFPRPAAAADENRIPPYREGDQSTRRWTQRGQVTAETFGLEHVVAIAVPARRDEPAASFECLTQPTLEQAKVKLRGNPDQTLQSPLGQLLQNALYGEGTVRGAAFGEHHAGALWLPISWNTVPGSPPLTRGRGPAKTDAPPPPATLPPSPNDTTNWERFLYVGIGLMMGLVLLVVLRRRPQTG